MENFNWIYLTLEESGWVEVSWKKLPVLSKDFEINLLPLFLIEYLTLLKLCTPFKSIEYLNTSARLLFELFKLKTCVFSQLKFSENISMIC